MVFLVILILSVKFTDKKNDLIGRKQRWRLMDGGWQGGKLTVGG